jgi:hypothetical protein
MLATAPGRALLDPLRQRSARRFIFRWAADSRLGVLLEPMHGFALVLHPITDIVPLFLQRLPHPKTPEFREFCVGQQIRGNQQQRAASGTTPLFPVSKVPLAAGTFIAFRFESQSLLFSQGRSLCRVPGCCKKLFEGYLGRTKGRDRNNSGSGIPSEFAAGVERQHFNLCRRSGSTSANVPSPGRLLPRPNQLDLPPISSESLVKRGFRVELYAVTRD